jgi:hypothetical protein
MKVALMHRALCLLMPFSSDCEGDYGLEEFEVWPGCGTLGGMLFMAIERFKPDSVRLIGARFKQSGRMLPEGVTYHASWVDSTGTRCFQVMEAPRPELLEAWISRWDDLIDFEVVPVLTSADFWANAKLA